MSKIFKDALGSVGPALYDILSAIVKTNDLAASGQLATFKEIIQLALLAKKEGIELDDFLKVMSVFRRERAGFLGGEIEMAGSAATGFETKEGSVLHVDFNAGGNLAGFTLGLNAGYEKEDQKSVFERSSQNFRILARWQVVPSDVSDEVIKTAVEYISKASPGAEIPGLPESFESPTLQAIKEMLPELREVFKK